MLILNLILSLILVILAVSYFLVVWFDGAKFFVEYLKLFGLSDKILHVKKFLANQKQGSFDTYLDYISLYKDSFLTRLVTCPKCFSIWVSTIFYFYANLIVFIAIDKNLATILFLYSSFAIPAVAFCSLFLYSKTK